jgi:Holliday junction resolvase-like predicted endonuclease
MTNDMSWDDIRALMADTSVKMADISVKMAENAAQQAENAAQQAKFDVQLEKNAAQLAENAAQLAENARKREESSARVDAQLAKAEAAIEKNAAQQVIDAQERAQERQERKEAFAKLDAAFAETELQIKETNRMVGGMANSDGAHAEECFGNSLSGTLMFAGQHYDFIDRNLKRNNMKKVKGEFDIIMYNGKSVALIEVKYKAQKADLEEMVEKKVPVFRTLFPQYKDHTINLGIASLSFDKFVIKKAKELGIGTLTQKGNTIEIDTENIRAY